MLFQQPASDIDMIVSMDRSDPFIYAENYFALKFALEDTLNRKIDLLEEQNIRNRFLKQNIERTKLQIYAAE